MTTPSSVATSVPATAVAPALYPWRNHVHTFSDGARCILYSDGSGALVAKVSKDGQANTTATVAASPTPTTTVFGVNAVPTGWNTGTTLTDTTTARGTGIIGSISGTTITLSTGFTSAPVAGDVVQYTSWSTPVTVVPSGFASGMTALVDACVVTLNGNQSPYVGDSLLVVVGKSNGTVDVYRLPYANGALGTTSSVTALIAGLTTVPQSIRCAFDPLNTTVDTNHNIFGATGIVHVLVDSGTAWNVYALDPGTIVGYNAINTKLVLSSPTLLPSVSGPTYATNVALRTTGDLYAITPGATAWYGRELLYQSSSSSVGATVDGPQPGVPGPTAGTTVLSQSSGASALGYWAICGTPNYSEGIYTGAIDNQGYTVLTASQIGGYTYPTGQWTYNANLSSTGWSNPSYQVVARIYEHTSSNQYTLRGTLVRGGTGYQVAPTITITGDGSGATATATIDSTGHFVNGITMTNGGGGYTHATVTFSLPQLSGIQAVGVATISAGSITGITILCGNPSIAGWTMGTLSSLYIELDLYLATSPGSGSGSIATGTGAISSPVPTVQHTSSKTINQYTWGAAETPTLPLSAYGASLVPTIDSNPALDLFCYDLVSNQIVTQQRYATGGYSPILKLGGSNIQNGGTAAAMDPVTGNEVVFYLAQFTGVVHVAALQRSGGPDTPTWGGQTKIDNDGTAVQSFCGIQRDGYGKAGPAIVSVDSGSPVTIWYDDTGALAASGQAAAPDQLAIIDNAGTNDAFGTTTPFVVTDAAPLYQFRYNITAGGSASNRMGALEVLVTDHTGATIWDSGKTSVANGPLPGALYSVQHGAVGNPITTALTVSASNPYTVVITTWDVSSNTRSPASATMQFYYCQAPTITLDGNAAQITSFTEGLTFDFWQNSFLPGSLFEAIWTDASGATVLDSGLLGLGTTLQPTNLQAAASAGQNQVTLLNSYPSGTVLWLDPVNSVGLREQVTTTGTPTGSGPYVHTLTSTLLHNHANLAAVSQQGTTPSLTLWPGLPNNETVTLDLNVYASFTNGPSFAGVGTQSFTTDFPAPPAPHDLIAIPVEFPPNPTVGGYVALRFVQDAGSSSQIVNPATWNIYQRETGTTAWTLVENLPARVGTHEVQCWSAPHNVAQDFAASAVSADGVESTLAVCQNVTLGFFYGIWFNDASNPASCIAVGQMDSQNEQFPEWLPTSDVDWVTPFNRVLPVTTVGPAYSYGLMNTITYQLPTGYELTCIRQLKAWDQAKTLLQCRDQLGQCFYVNLKSVHPTASVGAVYKDVVLDIQQVDPGTYDLLATIAS